MATKNQQQAAPTMEETLNKSEAFFLKNKKAIIAVVVALIVIIAGAVLYKTYISEPNEQKQVRPVSMDRSRLLRFIQATISSLCVPASMTTAGIRPLSSNLSLSKLN